MEILHSKVSLIIFNLIIIQQNPYKIEKTYGQEQTFFFKMSNLFGQVGRVENRVIVKTYFCPYQGTGQVGQTQFGHMYNLSYFFLLQAPLKPFFGGIFFCKIFFCKIFLVNHFFRRSFFCKIFFGKIFSTNCLFFFKKIQWQNFF